MLHTRHPLKTRFKSKTQSVPDLTHQVVVSCPLTIRHVWNPLNKDHFHFGKKKQKLKKRKKNHNLRNLGDPFSLLSPPFSLSIYTLYRLFRHYRLCKEERKRYSSKNDQISENIESSRVFIRVWMERSVRDSKGRRKMSPCIENPCGFIQLVVKKTEKELIEEMQQRKLTEESEHMQALLCVHNFACACSPLFLSVAYLSLSLSSLSLSQIFLRHFTCSYHLFCCALDWWVMWIRLIPFHFHFVMCSVDGYYLLS